MTWFPIEAAPKDGTSVLLVIAGRKSPWIGEWVHSQHYRNGVKTSDDAYWTTPWLGVIGNRPVPTHWQPIEALPMPAEHPVHAAIAAGSF